MDCTSEVHLTEKIVSPDKFIVMNKSIFSLIFAVILSSMVFPAMASKGMLSGSTISATSENSAAGIDRKKKRKIKKKVRQAGKVYKLVKSDKQDKKKARKVQRKIRRVINIF